MINFLFGHRASNFEVMISQLYRPHCSAGTYVTYTEKMKGKLNHVAL